MADNKTASQQPKQYINPQETLRSIGGGNGFGPDKLRNTEQPSRQESPKEQGFANPEFKTAFNLTAFNEGEKRLDRINELKSIVEEIRQEVKIIKRRSSELTSELDKVDAQAMQSTPDRVGIYHVRYYELLLKYLRNLSTKVGEAKTWMMAMNSKKAARGSAFASRTKKKGTQYSMSQELQLARSTG